MGAGTCRVDLVVEGRIMTDAEMVGYYGVSQGSIAHVAVCSEVSRTFVPPKSMFSATTAEKAPSP